MIVNHELLKKSNTPHKLEFLMLIAGRKQKDALLAELSAAGLKLINTMYGKGTVQIGYIQNVLGLIPEENKIVITGLMQCESSDAIFDLLVNKFHFNKPNTGIAFTIPIDKMSF